MRNNYFFKGTKNFQKSYPLTNFKSETGDTEVSISITEEKEFIQIVSPKKILFITLPYFLLFFIYCGINYDVEKASKVFKINSKIFGKILLPITLVFLYQTQKALNLMPRIYNYLHKKPPEKSPLIPKDIEIIDNENFMSFVTPRQFSAELLPTATMLIVVLLNNIFFDKFAKTLDISDNVEVGVVSLLFLTFIYYLFDITQLSSRLHNIGLKYEPEKKLPIQSIKNNLISNIMLFVLMGGYALINYFNKPIANFFGTTPTRLGGTWLPLLSTCFFIPFILLNPVSRGYNRYLGSNSKDKDEENIKQIRINGYH